MAPATQFQSPAASGGLMSRGRELNRGVRRRMLLARCSVHSRGNGSCSPLVVVSRPICLDNSCRSHAFTGIRRISPVVRNQVKRNDFLARVEFSSGSEIGSTDAEGCVNPLSIKDERRQPVDSARVNSALIDAS